MSNNAERETLYGFAESVEEVYEKWLSAEDYSASKAMFDIGSLIDQHAWELRDLLEELRHAQAEWREETALLKKYHQDDN